MAHSGGWGRRHFLATAGRTLAISALAPAAGCRPAPPAPSEPPRLRVELPLGELLTARALLESAVRDHAKRRGYVVDLSFAAPEDLPSRYPPGGEAMPDVAVAGTLGPARLFWGVSLLDVTEAAERMARRNGEMPPALRRALTFDKKLWAIPFYGRAWAWLLRQDLLDARGIAAPNTLAEALEAAAKLADPPRGLAGWSLPLVSSREGESLVHQVILDYGGSLADQAGQRVVLASPETVEAIGFLASLVRSPAARASLPSGRQAWSAPARQAEFLAGRVGMAPVSAELYSRIVQEKTFPRKALRAISPPGGPKRRTTSAEGRHFVVAAATKRPDLCLDLVAELLSPARLREFMVAADGAAVPAYADLTSDPFWDADPLRPAFATNVRGDSSRQLELVEYGFPGPGSAGAAEVAAQLVLSGTLARCAEDLMAPDLAVREGHQRAQLIYESVARTMASIRRKAGR